MMADASSASEKRVTSTPEPQLAASVPLSPRWPPRDFAEGGGRGSRGCPPWEAAQVAETGRLTAAYQPGERPVE